MRHLSEGRADWHREGIRVKLLSSTPVKTFFLVGSLVIGATVAMGSAEAAKAMWLALVCIGVTWLWFRKPKHTEKRVVETEYSEVEIRELFTALTAAKTAAPFRRVGAEKASSHDRYEEFG